MCIRDRFVGFLADIVAADVDLYLAVAVEYVGEAGLAHHAARHHPAGDGDLLPLQRVVAGAVSYTHLDVYKRQL